MVLKESLVLSVVKDASSELVKMEDQSLDVASENSGGLSLFTLLSTPL